MVSFSPLETAAVVSQTDLPRKEFASSNVTSKTPELLLI